MDDIASQIRTAGRALLQQSTAEVGVAVDEHSSDFEMLEAAEQADIVVEDRARCFCCHDTSSVYSLIDKHDRN